MGGFNPGHERFYRTIASSIHIGEVVFTSSTRGNPFIAFKAGGGGLGQRLRQDLGERIGRRRPDPPPRTASAFSL